MGTNKNKATRQNSNRKIVSAIKKHLSGSVTLEGVKYAPAKLAKMFQDGIDVADATDAASKAWHAAVATEQASTQGLSSVQTLLRNYVSATYGETSTVFSDFGFVPRAVRTVDAATKAEAVQKREATRVARHTMGKRQKKDVTGETSSATSSPTAVAAPAAPAVAGATSPAPVVSASTASNSQLNGAAAPAKAVGS
jgi:hypothetical protein